MGWFGFDLDGTLAYDRGVYNRIGDPVPSMVERLRKHLELGDEVRIFTARVAHDDEEENAYHRRMINEWCWFHFGRLFPITAVKDMQCIAFYDDRAIQITTNTGERADGN